MILELVTAGSTQLLKAQAYLDPGSGSFIIQLVIAALVGAAFVFRGTLSKIKRFFNRSKTDEVEEPKDGE
jgi:hypothetical protein